jgi:hypothetical protein
MRRRRTERVRVRLSRDGYINLMKACGRKDIPVPRGPWIEVTVDLDPVALKRARYAAQQTGKTLSQVLDDLLLVHSGPLPPHPDEGRE